MATFMLVHGACTGGWCWEKVAPLLEANGHRVCAPDLPGLGKDNTPPANVTLADNVEKLSYALVDEEKGSFGYATREIDWWEYWINIHIPALRRWTYPLIEGRPLEARPPRTFQLVPANGDAVKTGTNGATWRYS